MKISKAKSCTESIKIDLTKFYGEDVFVEFREVTFYEARLLEDKSKIFENFDTILPNALIDHNIFEDDGKTLVDSKEVIKLLFSRVEVSQFLLEGYLSFLARAKRKEEA